MFQWKRLLLRLQYSYQQQNLTYNDQTRIEKIPHELCRTFTCYIIGTELPCPLVNIPFTNLKLLLSAGTHVGRRKIKSNVKKYEGICDII